MIAQVFKDRTCDSIQPVLLDHARRDQHFSACRIVRNPLSFPLGNSLTSYSCRKSSVNVHDAPPRNSTAPIVHNPPHDARTGTNRTGDHPIGGHSPLGNLLHDPQDSLDEFFSHSSFLLARTPRYNAQQSQLEHLFNGPQNRLRIYRHHG